MEITQLPGAVFSYVKQKFESLAKGLSTAISAAFYALKNSFASSPEPLVDRDIEAIDTTPESLMPRIQAFTSDPEIRAMLLAYSTFGHRYPSFPPTPFPS